MFFKNGVSANKPLTDARSDLRKNQTQLPCAVTCQMKVSAISSKQAAAPHMTMVVAFLLTLLASQSRIPETVVPGGKSRIVKYEQR